MNESITDIVREMRDGFNKSWRDIDREWAHGLADRIEAAHNREKDSYKDTIKPWCDKVGVVKMETTTKENLVVGNNAKMREALKQIAEMSDHWYYGVDTSKSSEDVVIACGQLAEAALAAPPRNCDRFECFRDAVRAFGETGYAYEEMAEWLFAEAEGDAE